MSGTPVAVAVDVPRLELDRPFTYLLPDGAEPKPGLLVSVPFHGRTVRGWVLGPTDDVPARVLPVRRVLSSVPLFDQRHLALYRWIGERYLTPLSVVIDRAHPPRVASEESAEIPPPAPAPQVPAAGALGRYAGGGELLEAARSGRGGFAVRPLPAEEATVCLEAVAACVDGGRDAVVVVPEAEPVPATARAVLDAFGASALLLAGGDRRERYRAWLDVLGGRYRVVVGTRPAVFGPVRSLGLVWVNREGHPGHREERAPYHHVREIALARAQLEGAVCVLSAHAHSAEAAALAAGREIRSVHAPRQRERAASPLVEATRPEREDRSPRLTALLRSASGAFLMLARHGYGRARTCRSCGQPVACALCAGPVTVRERRVACAVCGAEARCAACGSQRFGIERGGTERIHEWAARVTRLPVRRIESGQEAQPPGGGRVLVGTAAAVKDFGPVRVPLVAILDPDRARRRAGLGAPEQALATWMEAAAWAGPREEGGRVLVQTRDPGDPAIQALVRWDPEPLHRSERVRREEAGFPPGFPVFRVVGGPDLAGELAALRPHHLLSSSAGAETVCLLTLRPQALARFRARVRALAQEGIVTRVEAEPQL